MNKTHTILDCNLSNPQGWTFGKFPSRLFPLFAIITSRRILLASKPCLSVRLQPITPCPSRQRVQIISFCFLVTSFKIYHIPSFFFRFGNPTLFSLLSQIMMIVDQKCVTLLTHMSPITSSKMIHSKTQSLLFKKSLTLVALMLFSVPTSTEESLAAVHASVCTGHTSNFSRLLYILNPFPTWPTAHPSLQSKWEPLLSTIALHHTLPQHRSQSTLLKIPLQFHG